MNLTKGLKEKDGFEPPQLVRKIDLFDCFVGGFSFERGLKSHHTILFGSILFHLCILWIQ